MAGFFITLEGIDFCGKTTQARLLSSYLERKGHEVLLLREPGGDRIAEKIRKVLLSEKNSGMTPLSELLLYEASRAQLTQKVILPALEAGKVVVCDRYFDSTLAYQGYGRGLDEGMIERLNKVSTFGLSPDLTLLLDIPLKTSLQRRKKGKRKTDRLESERIQFHRKIREGYLKIARTNQRRMKVIDGSGDVLQTWENVRTVVDSFLNKRGGKNPELLE
ncbi:MAG: dTMP kinase [Candidatus Zixiibacteriota bacterium]